MPARGAKGDSIAVRPVSQCADLYTNRRDCHREGKGPQGGETGLGEAQPQTHRRAEDGSVPRKVLSE